MAGYLLFAPWGPFWSKLSASEITLPLRTSRAAATMSSGWVKLSVPTSSAGPQRPQFLNFSAASRRSWRLNLRAVMALDHGEGKRVAYQAAAAAAVLALGWVGGSKTLGKSQARPNPDGLAFPRRHAG